jgi:hypothetical protein
VDRVHDDDSSVLAISRCEVLKHGQFNAAVVVVCEVIHAGVADPVVEHLQDCDDDDDGDVGVDGGSGYDGSGR